MTIIAARMCAIHAKHIAYENRGQVRRACRTLELRFGGGIASNICHWPRIAALDWTPLRRGLVQLCSWKKDVLANG
jgi:hypothetical protein